MPKKAADPTVRYTRLEVDGKSYQLAYDFDAIATAEEQTGMPLLSGVDWANIGVRRLRAMLYASMLKAQPLVTLAEVTPLIRPRNMPAIEAALVESWVRSHPEPEAANPPEPDEAPAAAD